MLKVKNTGRSTFVLNLARGVDYEDGSHLPHRIDFPESVVTADGTPGVRNRALSQPASITWLPGETRDDVPGQVELLEDFRNAKRAGILRLVEDAPVKEARPSREGKSSKF